MYGNHNQNWREVCPDGRGVRWYTRDYREVNRVIEHHTCNWQTEILLGNSVMMMMWCDVMMFMMMWCDDDDLVMMMTTPMMLSRWSVGWCVAINRFVSSWLFYMFVCVYNLCMCGVIDVRVRWDKFISFLFFYLL